MELLSFDCTRCDGPRLVREHERNIEMAQVIIQLRNSGWIVFLDEPNIDTRFGVTAVSFAGVCPDCRFLDYTVESRGE